MSTVLKVCRINVNKLSQYFLFIPIYYVLRQTKKQSCSKLKFVGRLIAYVKVFLYWSKKCSRDGVSSGEVKQNFVRLLRFSREVMEDKKTTNKKTIDGVTG